MNNVQGEKINNSLVKLGDFFQDLSKNWIDYILFIQKGFFIVLALIYTIFAIVIVRQVSLMSKNVQDKFNYVLIVFSYIHLALSILLTIFTLFIS